jgi:UDPglucose 6-dehydrogenase
VGAGGSVLKIAVLGLWHLGSVTAACLAASGHRVRTWDPDVSLLAKLKNGKLPVKEPGLQQEFQKGISSGKIRLCDTCKEAVQDCDVVWIAFDTPVDNHDRALVYEVEKHVLHALPESKRSALFILSSQLPVLTTRRLEIAAQKSKCSRAFAVIPENLRLGQAMDVFLRPDRVVAGVRDLRSREIIKKIYRHITPNIIFMGVESAEMTKHAINGFLAVSITFMNEIARICEVTGADAREVEKGLKTESRIGPKAYLRAGSAFAGGTLARDVLCLSQIGRKMKSNPILLPSIYRGNQFHGKWLQNKLCALFPSLKNRKICVWGVTYKPGTSTLRRSQAVSLIQWLYHRQAKVRFHDPHAEALPPLRGVIRVSDPLSALKGADVLLIATPWTEYREIPFRKIAKCLKGKTLLDPNGFLEVSTSALDGLNYHRVGASCLT